jgi:hypothetical protein
MIGMMTNTTRLNWLTRRITDVILKGWRRRGPSTMRATLANTW